MFELILLGFLLSKKLRIQKYMIIQEEEEDFPILKYNPGLISYNEINNGIFIMQRNIFVAATLIYTQILSLLNNDKTVIQIQMYGLGSIWRTEILDDESNGTFQLAVAFKLASKFHKQYPNLKLTSQDPIHLISEIEYLRMNYVYVFEGKTFSPDFFQNSLTECNRDVSNPIMICYMIHFPIDAFEDFLSAHWVPEILSKIIFVGNSFDGSCFAEYISKCKKTIEFFKVVNRKLLSFERPPIIYYDPKDLWGYHPFYGHPSDFLAWKAFHNTDVYMISYEDASKIVKQIS